VLRPLTLVTRWHSTSEALALTPPKQLDGRGGETSTASVALTLAQFHGAPLPVTLPKDTLRRERRSIQRGGTALKTPAVTADSTGMSSNDMSTKRLAAGVGAAGRGGRIVGLEQHVQRSAAAALLPRVGCDATKGDARKRDV